MENDKNRVGEKTTFIERANEDLYFAGKEHELIEGMKAEFQLGAFLDRCFAKDETGKKSS
jgi:hypothetical protein